MLVCGATLTFSEVNILDGVACTPTRFRTSPLIYSKRYKPKHANRKGKNCKLTDKI